MEQTYPEDGFEIIVVDNGSSDGSVELVEAYPVRFYQMTNTQSPYVCRNKGIREAKGKLIVLLDAKCQPVPEFLSAGIEMLQQHSLYRL